MDYKRQLKIISTCSHAMIHATDEFSLLQEICRIIVDIGGYRAAWVGYIQEYEGAGIRPVAQAGFEEGYLERLRISGSDIEEQHSPTCIAVRTGEMYIAKDILNNPNCAAWRSDAVERGYSSVIVFSLIANRKIFGVLNIYSAKPDSFDDEEEVKLLKELVDELDFGVMSLRARVERREAEETLRESRERFTLFMENLRGVAFMKDIGGWYVYVNKTWEETFKRKLEDVFTKSDYEIWSPDIAEQIRANDKLVLESRKPLEVIEAIPQEDGLHYWIVVRFPIYDKEGTLTMIGGIAIDITERKRAEEELKEYSVGLEEKVKDRTRELEFKKGEAEEAKIQAEIANKTKSDFLANMSHELRTPLHSILGFTELLQKEMFGALNEKQREYIKYVLASSEHLLSLINDTLDLSKVESGKMELEVSSFSLKELLNTTAALLKERAIKYEVTMNLEIQPEADIAIEADERKLKQIIFNLLSNAIKFTPSGYPVSLLAKKIKNVDLGAKAIESEKPDKEYIEISVEDKGIGIKPQDLDKLFVPFSQLEAEYSKEQEGTGLGLVLTKRFVELNKGKIWVESEYGKGSKFSFIIPLRIS